MRKLSLLQNHLLPQRSKHHTRVRDFFILKDEILILKGPLDFKSKTGQNTMTHYTTFYNLFKDLLSIKPTKKHLAKYLEVKAQI